jgi:formamidopyrimidine-DNA glycosylase
MPELPEVETICRSLNELLPGRRIAAVDVLERRLRTNVDRGFEDRVRGREILAVRRRGKYICIALEGNLIWICHLGMSGKLIHVQNEKPRERHDHIMARLDDGHELRYHDPRRFGLVAVIHAEEAAAWPHFRGLGPDPLDASFDGRYLHEQARRSRRRVRDLLLDQTVVAGLGNIYVNEILFRCGIRPTARAFKLRRERSETIARVTREVLEQAIAMRGTSFSDYRDGRDRKGEFQNFLRVYDREGESCAICRNPIKRVVLGNRSAFYCRACQK